jgi:hypothetical protein
MTGAALPERVCVLDLETARLIDGEPAETPLAFVGTMVCELRAGSGDYAPGPHRVYLPGDLPGLFTRLEAFEGIVLGHNVLNFDYEVLFPEAPPVGGPPWLVGKTVDTLAFLYERRVAGPELCPPDEPYPPVVVGAEALSGLSLDNLARRNLGTGGKAVSGRSIPKMWREGRREEVIAYNRRDLELTFGLWRHMVSGHPVEISDPGPEPRRGGSRLPTSLALRETDLARLAGRAPLFETRTVRVFDGPRFEPLGAPSDALEDIEDEERRLGRPWYRGCSARHYPAEDRLLIEPPLDLGMEGFFVPAPFPASRFELRWGQPGPPFPARLSRAERRMLADAGEFL